jgi:uncharacterized ferritin-like protein (DUF455 family)
MKNLYQQSKECFLTADPIAKTALTEQLAGQWFSGKLEWKDGETPLILNEPGRLEKPEIVLPKDLIKRKLGSEVGRAALIHSLAHIELTAVNLALDTIYRYRGLPKEYYDDWIQCAREEAGHFMMLRERLIEMGFDYGSFSAHNELWKMAVSTADDLMDRMGVVHRAFEARALDVIPSSLVKFERLNDTKMVKVLTVICNDEIGHVNSGTRWFRYRCEQENLDPDTTFFRLLEKYMGGSLAGPFNREARLKAGFSEQEMDYLELNDRPKRQFKK